MRCLILTLALLAGCAQAFVALPRAMPRAVEGRVAHMPRFSSAFGTTEPVEPVEPAKSSAIVPVNDDTVKATVGITGAATGLVLAGPYGAAILAILANYGANKDGDAGQIINSVGKAVLQTYNLLAKTNENLGVTDSLAKSIQNAIDNAKAGETGESVAKAEEALNKILAQAEDLNAEYGIVPALVEALAKAGDLSIEAIDALLKFADENQLGDKAKKAIEEASEKVKAR